MAFLGKLLGFLLAPFLNWLIDKVSKAMERWNAMRLAREAAEEENKRIREQLEKAQTKEERDAAAQSVFDKLGRD